LSIAKYLQDHIESSPDDKSYMKLIKLIFFTDRYHIRNNGVLSTFDIYDALPYGPIASKSKNLLLKDFDWLSGCSDEETDFIEKHVKVDTLSKNVILTNIVDYDYLSRSNIIAMDFACEHFKKFGRFEIANLTHDYPEWGRFKDLFVARQTQQEVINMDDFFKNINIAETEYMKNHFEEDPFKEDEEFLNDMCQEYHKINKFESIHSNLTYC